MTKDDEDAAAKVAKEEEEVEAAVVVDAVARVAAAVGAAEAAVVAAIGTAVPWFTLRAAFNSATNNALNCGVAKLATIEASSAAAISAGAEQPVNHIAR